MAVEGGEFDLNMWGWNGEENRGFRVRAFGVELSGVQGEVK